MYTHITTTTTTTNNNNNNDNSNNNHNDNTNNIRKHILQYYINKTQAPLAVRLSLCAALWSSASAEDSDNMYIYIYI